MIPAMAERAPAARPSPPLDRPAGGVPPTVLVLGAIGSVQIGAALAKDLFPELGPGGTVLLRVAFAAGILVALWRPRARGLARSDLRLALAFGLSLAGMNLAFYSALERLPLGVAVTIEFVGPLGVAVALSRRRADFVWVLLAAGGVVLLLATTGQLANARNGFAATLVILPGLVLATAPLWRRLLDQRAAERAARIRSEERAAVAAHLHDSVLQTLALIQRYAEEPQAVSRLARSQERELRAWLYEPAAATGGTWAGLVAGMVADVEADHALTVDPVVVGDAPVDDDVAALGAATREALVNAAKHSGAPSADLYTEVTPERISVFVRDRGAGFDPAIVPADRRGLRDSVTGRLTRTGGTAVIRSAPGEGTEVELTLPRRAAA